MSYRSNLTTIRAGSQERITFTLKVNGEVYDLTNFTKAQLHLKNIETNAVTIYATDDTSPILSFDADRTTGRIHLDPLITTFTNSTDFFAGYIDVTHTNGKVYSFEEDEEFGLKIRDQFSS